MTIWVFKLSFDKLLQSVAVILRTQPTRRMNYMRLLKLLYISDRRCLEATGKLITGDRPSAMERGPILSATYNLIKGEHPKSDDWERFVQTDHYEVFLVEDPGRRKLSPYEIELLHSVVKEFEDFDEWDMVNWTHVNLGEWIKNNPEEGSSSPISLSDILVALNMKECEEDIVNDERERQAIDKLFNPCGPSLAAVPKGQDAT